MADEKFDPLTYIENAFLDRRAPVIEGPQPDLAIDVPTLGEFVGQARDDGQKPLRTRTRFRRRQLSAPRPRRARDGGEPDIDPDLREAWRLIPRNIEFLSTFFDDRVTAHYYRGQFKESRAELIRRLIDPELTLEEVSRLLGVCPATVRRYTNRGWLEHHRTKGGQRRFRLSGVVRFVEQHGRHPEE